MSREFLVAACFFASGAGADLPIVAVANLLANEGYSVTAIFAINAAANSTWSARAATIRGRRFAYWATLVAFWAHFATARGAAAPGLVVAAAASAFFATAADSAMVELGVDAAACQRAYYAGKISGALAAGAILSAPGSERAALDAAAVVALFGGVSVVAAREARPAERDSAPAARDVEEIGAADARWTAACLGLAYCVPHYGTVAYYFLTGPLNFSPSTMALVEALNGAAVFAGTFEPSRSPIVSIAAWLSSCVVAALTMRILVARYDAIYYVPDLAVVAIPTCLVSFCRSRAETAYAVVLGGAAHGDGTYYAIGATAPKLGKYVGVGLGLALLTTYRLDHDDFGGIGDAMAVVATCAACLFGIVSVVAISRGRVSSRVVAAETPSDA